MIISDLNHIEVVNEETNIIGAGFSGRVYFRDNKYIDINKRVNIKERFESIVKVRGNAATAEATADAKGKDSLAETITDAQANSFGSSAISLSVAFVN
ncbi:MULTISPECIES: hypothetical protein [unclassified Moorena]|uniref:hypothetical protein n=1 Tax=unclassified Moorena TaxID=2683338 RepID=UPI0013FF0DB9|nr:MULTISPECIES: hypothetical protein [unclassified Moorena]NEO15683.1 hypothetical protein [Moorena sp. SIO3E8]NEQ02062.1 hypothetical protein [Moorena sp. SIO3F7]